jgi:RNA polymerase sigma-70 factor (ECF subfamily)
LVAAAQGGDRFALDQLLRRHYDRIHAVCRRIAGTNRDADDACQEALIKIVRNLPRFDGRSSFGTWAYRIATNASLDELRKRDRRPMLHAVDDRDRPEVVDPTAQRRTESFADQLLLDEALEQLPDDLRLAVVLRDVADLDYAEIAETLDVPIGTVKSRISRGRAALAAQLRLDAVDARERGNREPTEERPIDPT